MPYVSIARWRDLEDMHVYNAGDAYPHDGREISADRIAELTDTRNKAGFAVIKATEAPAEEKPVQTAASPKKATRVRKKTT